MPLIILFVFLTNPVSTHILVWAAAARKIDSSPETTGRPIDDPKEKAVVESDSNA